MCFPVPTEELSDSTENNPQGEVEAMPRRAAEDVSVVVAEPVPRLMSPPAKERSVVIYVLWAMLGVKSKVKGILFNLGRNMAGRMLRLMQWLRK